jgi:hypothetical protein
MSAEECRRHAADCIAVAERVADSDSKARLLEMASAWLRLAEQADKNSKTDLVYETPPAPE